MKLLILIAVITASLSLTAMAADVAKVPGKLKHMVAFKFKDGTTPEEIKKLNDAFKALEGKIPQIKSFDAGANNSPEGLNKGHTHGYLLTFDSETDRNAYLVHPAHKEFGGMAMKILADVFVVDFASGNFEAAKASK